MSSSPDEFQDTAYKLQEQSPDISGCDICGEQHETDSCTMLQGGIIVEDSRAPSRARLTLPSTLRFKKLKAGGESVAAREKILRGTRFGPLEANAASEQPLHTFIIKVFGKDGLYHFLDISDEEKCNWMCLVAPSATANEQNLMMFQVHQNIYYSAIRDIRVHEELKVWYAPNYGKKLGALPLPLEEALEEPSSTSYSIKEEKIPSPVPERRIVLPRRGRKRKLYQGFVELSDPSITSLLDDVQTEVASVPDPEMPVEPAREWQCSQCSDIYTDSVRFAHHLRKHYQPPKVEDRSSTRLRGVKSHSCQFCAAKFSSAKLLHRHRLRLHRRQMRRPKTSDGEKIALAEEYAESATSVADNALEDIGSCHPLVAGKAGEKRHISDTDAASILLAIEANCDKPDDQTVADSPSSLLPDREIGGDIPAPCSDDTRICSSSLRDSYLIPEAAIAARDLVQMAVDETEIAMVGGEPRSREEVLVVEANQKKAYSCDICLKAFEKSFNLYRHIRKHTGEFICKKCHKAFARKENLIKHTCNDTLAFECTNCPKRFATTQLLKRHAFKHQGDDKGEEGFTCNYCGKSLASSDSLNEHVCKKIENEENHSCEICHKTFSKLQYLVRHFPVHTGTHACSICGKWLRSQDSLYNHMRICTQGIEKEGKDGVASCPHCREEFSESKAYRRHVFEHTHPYACDSCGARFRNKVSQAAHLCDGLADCKMACDECGEQFSTLAALNQHSLSHGEGTLRCKTCNISFKSLEEFDAHKCHSKKTAKKFKDHDMEPLICDLCGSQFSSTSSLNVHRRLHGEKQFVCSTCHKRFHRKDLLLDHMSVHEAPSIPCHICDKMFKTKKSLDVHFLIHDGIKRFTCSMCPKQFYQKGNLIKHEEIHKPERRYECDFCTKSFSTKEYLAIHVLEHERGRMFSCKDCEKTFIKEHQLKAHVRMFHADLTYVCKFCGQSMKLKHSLKRHLIKKHSDEKEEWNNSKDISNMLMPLYDVNSFPNVDVADAEEMIMEETDLKREMVSDPENVVESDQSRVMFTLSGIGSEALQQALASGAARIQQGSTPDTIEISLPVSNELGEAMLANGLEGVDEMQTHVIQVPVTHEQLDSMDFQQEQLDQLQNAVNSALDENASPSMELFNSIEQNNLERNMSEENAILLENGTVLHRSISEEGNNVLYYIVTSDEQALDPAM